MWRLWRIDPSMMLPTLKKTDQARSTASVDGEDAQYPLHGPASPAGQ
jgi:hypothetical protein